MIRRDVKYRRDMGAKRLDGLELEARNLQHYPRLWCRLLNERDGGGADVAAHQRLQSACCNYFARKRGRGGLPVRTSDGDYFALQVSGGKLNLADDRCTAFPGVYQRRNVIRNARTYDDQVLI